MDTLSNLVVTQKNSFAQISPTTFLINILITLLLTISLRKFYTKFGRSVSNRKEFSYNFLLMTTTTMFIITVIKSSLALSLGLVGALSLIRFRTAIKEPEELSYLFFAISIGLGLGADQRLITVIAFFSILCVQYLQYRFKEDKNLDSNMFLNIKFVKNNDVCTAKTIELIKDSCTEVTLNRVDENTNNIEIACTVQFEDVSKINQLQKNINSTFSNAEFSLLNNRNIF